MTGFKTGDIVLCREHSGRISYGEILHTYTNDRYSVSTTYHSPKDVQCIL